MSKKRNVEKDINMELLKKKIYRIEDDLVLVLFL